MKYRDSSRATHFESNVIAGAWQGNANAVRVYGNSSSEKAGIEAVSDSTAADLVVRGKGSGGVYLGSTTPANSTSMTVMPFKGAFTSTLAFTQAAISSGQIAELKIASTTADVSPGDLVTYHLDHLTAQNTIDGGFRLSTAAASRMTVLLAVPGSSAVSTLSGVINIAWLDLT